MKQCFIGIGSNLNNPIEQVQTAIIELRQLSDSKFISASSLYQNKPLGPQDQPDFINAVVAVNTNLAALELLVQLQKIENMHGRVRKEHWGPRTLDLDLLLYGNETINLAELIVPHPGLTQRAFTLGPLMEIAPNLILPSGMTLRSFLQNISGLVRIESQSS